MARKSKDAFRTITEVSDWLETPAHVLRFWEGKFAHIKPVKRAGGRRYYRTRDMELLGGIKILLHVEGLSIKEVQERIKKNGPKSVAALSPNVNEAFVTPSPVGSESQNNATPPSPTAKVIDLPVAHVAPVANTDSRGEETPVEHAVQTSFIEDEPLAVEEVKPVAQAATSAAKKAKPKAQTDVLPGQMSLFEEPKPHTSAPRAPLEHVSKLITTTSVSDDQRAELQALQQKLAQLLERAA